MTNRGGKPQKLPAPWVVLQLLKCGWSKSDIARSYGVKHHTVSYFVQRHKFNHDPCRAPHPEKGPGAITHDIFLLDRRRSKYEPELPTGIATDGDCLHHQYTQLSDCRDLLREWGVPQEGVGGD